MENLLELFENTLNADYIQLEENTASYAVYVVDKTLYLYFEKSNGLVDWENNLDFPAKTYHEKSDTLFVHRGFLRVFETIKPHIERKILDMGLKKIIISGYSHGAALALLAHEHSVFLRQDLASNIYGYGFGCPRVVWGSLSEKTQERFVNFTVIRNCRDIVTHLPPKLFGYQHVGNMLHIGTNADYSPIDSHRAENYLKELRRL